ncbi:interferon-induced, double-stranded RNA-activated protein kinase [Erinaceus europaeus]|uniref:Interferon-induced, double-stranded RNA-activated protein kinase n=1 Tax=Erinaceus europaeus TaxID=9365 RepID=A0ABM3X6H7_ERIEU|nr:interferon-induced, double-stranded RNA-activated protein kinase [Erinaceus europaeus]
MMESDESPGAYIGKLNEYCQKHSVGLQYQELQKTGPPHDLRFTFQVVIGKRKFPQAEGKSKKEAKNAAAKAAVEILNRESKTENFASPATDDSFEVIFTENYIGLMNRLWQKNKLHVHYHFSDEKDGGPSRFYCECKVEEEKYGFGVGSTKQDAKQKAAQMAYNRILAEETPEKANLQSLHSIPSHNGSLSFSSAPSSENSLSDTTSGSSGYSEHSNNSELPSSSWGFHRLNQKKPVRQVSSHTELRLLTFKSKGLGQGSRPALDKFCVISIPLKVYLLLFTCRRLAASFDIPMESEHTANDRFLKDFRDITPIASGGFGQVFKARHRIDTKIYAIKRVKYDREKVEREVKALANLSHSNIVHYYDCWGGNDYYEDSMKNLRNLTRCLFIKMEYCDKGTLDDWIFKRKNSSQKDLALEFFRQITEGVHYIHSKEFIHRDLKPSNIFLVDEKQIKIGDFGLVTALKTNGKLTANLGTPQYMSPEQLSSVNYDNKVDIFALGLILAELLYVCGTTCETIKLFDKLRAGIFPDEFDKNEKSLLQKLLFHEPSKRPTAFETLQTLKMWTNGAKPKNWNTC